MSFCEDDMLPFLVGSLKGPLINFLNFMLTLYLKKRKKTHIYPDLSDSVKCESQADSSDKVGQAPHLCRKQSYSVSLTSNTGGVRYHCGGWSEEVNSCILISYMVYL